MIRFRLAIVALLLTIPAAYGAAPKRDFRGAWIQTIFQGYEQRTTDQNRAYLTNLLDLLQQTGINAVIFQVRPRADAFYKSDIEPWSGFLTGTVGKAPTPMWDPLQFMVEEAHKRGMELHAWLNPYRAPTVAEADRLPAGHLLKKQPERFVKYGKGYYFDPSRQDNRDLICDIVADIITRYEVDGIHFDDYFYPYPSGKLKFPDSKAYTEANTTMSVDDWRRHNVNLLIEQVARTIDERKPWVRFGISPFGIWRNASTDPSGSNTCGLQNYDDLFADVPLWAEKGWIDYQIPQLYWEINHSRAPYGELAPWWINNSRGRHVYIGQDAVKTHEFQELDTKLDLAANADGNCWWYAASLAEIAGHLRSKAYSTPALVPEYMWKPAEPASKPTGVTFDGTTLSWTPEQAAGKWVVYGFASETEIDIENPAAIRAVTYSPTYTPTEPGVYVITALDRTNCESAPSTAIKVNL